MMYKLIAIFLACLIIVWGVSSAFDQYFDYIRRHIEEVRPNK
jgi:hypothetical protein